MIKMIEAAHIRKLFSRLKSDSVRASSKDRLKKRQHMFCRLKREDVIISGPIEQIFLPFFQVYFLSAITMHLYDAYCLY